MTAAPPLPVAVDGSSALDVAERAAAAAADEIRRRLPDAMAPDSRERLRVTSKGGWNNSVTEVDLAAEDAALAVLREAFPSHAIVSEETGPHGTGSAYQWWVDPIDGTLNFAKGLPHICVSVGLWADGEPLAGALLDPVRDERFSAAAGQGATINGAPAFASSETDLREALLGFDMGYKGPEGKLLLSAIHDLWPGFQSVRMMGSAALGVTYAGCGRLDLYAHHYLQGWDLAAAILFVREAGGMVTDLNGGPARPESGSIVAGARGLHEAFMAAPAGSAWRASAR